MAVIETPRFQHFPWYVRLFFWSQKRRYGPVMPKPEPPKVIIE